MGKAVFDDAVFSFDSNTIGIIDVEIGESGTEIDASDISNGDNSAFIGGKIIRSISFTGFHKNENEMLPINESKSFILNVVDGSGDIKTYSGQCILFDRNLSGARNGAFQVAYQGKINGAITSGGDSS